MKRLGEILLDWGVIAHSELHTGLEACRRTGGRLGTQLLKFGFVDEHSLLEALSEQFGVPPVSETVMRRSSLEVRRLLPLKASRRLQAVSFGRTQEYVRVALASPKSPGKLDELAEIIGTKIEPYVATEAAIQAVLAELDDELVEVVIQTETSSTTSAKSLESLEWNELWNPPRVDPEHLLRSHRRRSPAPRPLVATFPALAPIARPMDAPDDVGIDEDTYRRRLADAAHRDEVGQLLLRYAAGYFARLCLFGVHHGSVIGWMARGIGVIAEDVETFQLSLDEPSVFREVNGGGSRHVGPIANGDGNDSLLEMMGEPTPAAVVLLPICVKDRVVAFLMGDNPGDEAVTLPVDEVDHAVQKAGMALEVLIMRRKILV